MHAYYIVSHIEALRVWYSRQVVWDLTFIRSCGKARIGKAQGAGSLKEGSNQTWGLGEDCLELREGSLTLSLRIDVHLCM